MANYAIMRIEKRKLPSVGRINKHHERQKEEYKSNPDIDRERTGLNYHIVQPPGPYREAALARIEQAGARRRKDSVVLQDCFVGGTPDWLKAKSQEEQRAYFSHAYQFFEDNFGKENIISAVVHMDEATPHMHLCFVPITPKGRLSSKDVIGGPQGLVKWQDRFYEHMRQRYPDLSRGLPKKLTHRKHVPPYMFKLTAELYKHYDEICQAINSIGVLNSGRKKDEAIALLGRYAPEMTQLKAQVASTDKQIADLERELAYVTEGRATAWRANQDYKQELEEANYKLYQLNREQKKLEGIISLIPPELLAQLTKTERNARKNQERGKNR